MTELESCFVIGSLHRLTTRQKLLSDVVCNMTLAKYNTALLIPELNKEMNVQIQDGAILAANEDINITRKLLEKKDKCDDKLIQMLSNWNKFSVVAYPVSYHFDIFIGDACH